MHQIIQVLQEQIIAIITTGGLFIVGYLTNLSKKKLETNSKEFKDNLFETVEMIKANNSELVKDMVKLTNKVDKLYKQFEVKVVSNNVLKKKFLSIIEEFDYKENSEFVDIYKVFMKKILTWVADYYTELNEANKIMGYKEKEEIIKYIQQLYNTETIKINIVKVNELSLKLLNDYTINKSEDDNYNLNLILDLTKVLVEQSYKIYQNGK